MDSNSKKISVGFDHTCEIGGPRSTESSSADDGFEEDVGGGNEGNEIA